MSLKTALPLAALLAATAIAVAGEAQPQAGGPRVIPVIATRYVFDPDVITLKKGETVIVELTAADRPHGFFVPELHLRADVLPDKTTRVTLKPEKAGTFIFRCDNFCGEGHEDMTGKIVVTNP